MEVLRRAPAVQDENAMVENSSSKAMTSIATKKPPKTPARRALGDITNAKTTTPAPAHTKKGDTPSRKALGDITNVAKKSLLAPAKAEPKQKQGSQSKRATQRAERKRLADMYAEEGVEYVHKSGAEVEREREAAVQAEIAESVAIAANFRLDYPSYFKYLAATTEISDDFGEMQLEEEPVLSWMLEPSLMDTPGLDKSREDIDTNRSYEHSAVSHEREERPGRV